MSSSYQDNHNRLRIVSFIEANPGHTLSELCNGLEINQGTMRYHLEVLIKEGKVVLRRISNRNHFFPTKARSRMNIASHLTRNQSRVLTIINDEPGITKSKIYERINITKEGLNYILNHLQKDGLIWKMKKEGVITFQPVTKQMILDEVMLDIIQMLIDKRIDQQTFLILKKQIEEEKVK
jgi:predicted transcriptional regulator